MKFGSTFSEVWFGSTIHYCIMGSFSEGRISCPQSKSHSFVVLPSDRNEGIDVKIIEHELRWIRIRSFRVVHFVSTNALYERKVWSSDSFYKKHFERKGARFMDKPL